MEARLYDKYVTEVVPALQQKFGYKNVNPVSYTHLTLPTKLEV